MYDYKVRIIRLQGESIDVSFEDKKGRITGSYVIRLDRGYVVDTFTKEYTKLEGINYMVEAISIRDVIINFNGLVYEELILKKWYRFIELIFRFYYK